MNDYEPTNEELDELEEELIRRYDSIEKGTIGREKLIEKWKSKQKRKRDFRNSQEVRLNLIRDAFPDADEGVHENFLSTAGNHKYITTWLEIIAQIEMRKLKALEKITETY